MPLLMDFSVTKNLWRHEGGERNGVSGAAPNNSPKKRACDAGRWELAVQKIVSFRDLGPDWDGLGAAAPSADLLDSAVGLAIALHDKGADPPHCTIAGVNGTVTFEWHDADGTYTEIEIVRPFHAEAMLIEPGQTAKHWTLPTD